MDHKKVAQVVIEAVGKDNLVAAAHCATRLRLVLKDDEKVNTKLLDSDPDVKGTFKTNGQYQIIIGPGDVNNVYDELIKMTGLQELSTDDLKKVSEKNKKTNPIMAFIKLLSDIFVPIIPALVAGGLLMALNNFLTSPGLFGPKALTKMYPVIAGPSQIIQVMSAAPFIFMPILVGISAAKRFGANRFLGATIGMIMTTPDLGGADKYWDIFGLHVAQTSYVYQVIPVLVAVWVLAFLEKRFHKWLPSAFDFTFTPLLSVFITGFLTFLIIGPVFKGVSDAITNAIVWLYNTTGAFGMGVFGLTYSAIVTTGLHQSFPAVETQLIAAYAQGKGAGDFIFVTACMANIAQGAATFAIYFLTKDKKVKGLASSSGVSALLGITEPALFGVNLKYKFPFFCALIGSGIAAAFAGFMHVTAASLGSGGLLGFLSIVPKTIPMWAVSALISFAVTFILTYVYGKAHFKEEVVPESATVESAGDAVAKQEKAEKQIAQDEKLHDEIIAAPVSGEAESLKDVNDPVFSTEAMGRGAAIVPDATDGTIYAPVSGTISVAYETKHAYGIQSDKGAEVLIHVGIDTVNLKGKHFTSEVKQGDHVEKGQKLGTADINAIVSEGYDPTVMVVVTNTPNYANVQRVDGENKQHGDDLIATTKR
ncbi:sucrose-specific PTS transporter subunit IIBC [Lactobacillus rodentium]|uniref:protein-N(pi)-phosphohistidine--sucrose phosphotransferase n=1 Tax=Lactobacillus rodentium TaxID=947835 RepID=A0A2Z6TGX4_9LACO|nr:sucrose-specific PTS transporter subunit IIBC [Lactobacillus rodentium]MCR1895043.1 sucrose-specific PTS transporter subunit IIBC [Lactobacillus rodentium]GBG05342.1 PTS system, sucrose-specific IIABC component [Lactobacillus rodentium]